MPSNSTRYTKANLRLSDSPDERERDGRHGDTVVRLDGMRRVRTGARLRFLQQGSVNFAYDDGTRLSDSQRRSGGQGGLALRWHRRDQREVPYVRRGHD